MSYKCRNIYAKNTTTHRHCWDCDSFYPATTDYFYRDRNRTGGLGTRCKECSKRAANNYNQQRREAGRAVSTEDNRRYKRARYQRHYSATSGLQREGQAA